MREKVGGEEQAEEGGFQHPFVSFKMEKPGKRRVYVQPAVQFDRCLRTPSHAHSLHSLCTPQTSPPQARGKGNSKKHRLTRGHSTRDECVWKHLPRM